MTFQGEDSGLFQKEIDNEWSLAVILGKVGSGKSKYLKGRVKVTTDNIDDQGEWGGKWRKGKGPRI